MASEPPAKTQGAAQRRRALFVEANAILDQEYASDLSLDQVARRIGASSRGLQRAFAEIGQTSFRGSLHDVRMQRAAELLRGSQLPVGEIARQVGYRQQGEFTRAFRRAFGCTPTAYRQS